MKPVGAFGRKITTVNPHPTPSVGYAGFWHKTAPIPNITDGSGWGETLQ